MSQPVYFYGPPAAQHAGGYAGGYAAPPPQHGQQIYDPLAAAMGSMSLGNNTVDPHNGVTGPYSAPSQASMPQQPPSSQPVTYAQATYAQSTPPVQCGYSYGPTNAQYQPQMYSAPANVSQAVQGPNTAPAPISQPSGAPGTIAASTAAVGSYSATSTSALYYPPQPAALGSSMPPSNAHQAATSPQPAPAQAPSPYAQASSPYAQTPSPQSQTPTPYSQAPSPYTQAPSPYTQVTQTTTSSPYPPAIAGYVQSPPTTAPGYPTSSALPAATTTPHGVPIAYASTPDPTQPRGSLGIAAGGVVPYAPQPVSAPGQAYTPVLSSYGQSGQQPQPYSYGAPTVPQGAMPAYPQNSPAPGYSYSTAPPLQTTYTAAPSTSTATIPAANTPYAVNSAYPPQAPYQQLPMGQPGSTQSRDPNPTIPSYQPTAVPSPAFAPPPTNLSPGIAGAPQATPGAAQGTDRGLGSLLHGKKKKIMLGAGGALLAGFLGKELLSSVTGGHSGHSSHSGGSGGGGGGGGYQSGGGNQYSGGYDDSYSNNNSSGGYDDSYAGGGYDDYSSGGGGGGYADTSGYDPSDDLAASTAALAAQIQFNEALEGGFDAMSSANF